MSRNRTCFSSLVVDSDAFLDMSVEARLMYYALGMQADSWGVITNPRSVARAIGVPPASIDELLSNGFVLEFENLDETLLLITHWWVNNKLDRRSIKQYKSSYLDSLLTTFMFKRSGNRVYVTNDDTDPLCIEIDEEFRLLAAGQQ